MFAKLQKRSPVALFLLMSGITWVLVATVGLLFVSEVVERACGEIDRSASAFLPNLKPGEAAIIGTDFPIPLTIQIGQPITKPTSYGPNYQKYWKSVAQGDERSS